MTPEQDPSFQSGLWRAVPGGTTGGWAEGGLAALWVGRLAAAKQTWGGGDRTEATFPGDLPAARRLSEGEIIRPEKRKEFNYVSGQYLFGKRRDRTYGGSSAGLQNEWGLVLPSTCQRGGGGVRGWGGRRR